MSHYHLYIENNTYLSTQNNQLLIKQSDTTKIPLEDIASIVIDNEGIIVTSHVLNRLCEYKVAVFFCNDKHLPNGLLLPFAAHSRTYGAYKLQSCLHENTKVEIWKKLLYRKIENSIKCLAKCNKETSKLIVLLMDINNSNNDSIRNIEATAAQYYFVLLFGDGFVRSEENIINGALNYGYAIIRGVIARSICAYGLMPFLGVNHKSELNNFNLADDIIEPYRSIIDLFVVQNINFDKKELDTQDKKNIYSLLNNEVEIENKTMSINASIDIVVSRYVSVLKNNDANLLQLPKLLDIKQKIIK